MNATTGRPDGEGDPLTRLFDCLASRDRRRVLGRLQDEGPDPVPRADLAAALAADRGDRAPDRGDGAPDRGTDDVRERARTALHHVHLPKLDDAGLVRTDVAGDAVARSDHPAYRDDGVRAAIEDGGAGDARATAEAASLDALFGALADRRRRTVLDVLCHQRGPVALETLARDVADRPDGEGAAVETVAASLRHTHVPHLAEAGLVSYDPEADSVAYEGHPRLRVPWLRSGPGPGFRERLDEVDDSDDVAAQQPF